MSIQAGAIVLPLKDAAEAVGLSADTLRKAIKATDPNAFPPPLRAKKAGHHEKAGYYIAADDLREWFARWPDA